MDSSLSSFLTMASSSSKKNTSYTVATKHYPRRQRSFPGLVPKKSLDDDDDDYDTFTDASSSLEDLAMMLPRSSALRSPSQQPRTTKKKSSKRKVCFDTEAIVQHDDPRGDRTSQELSALWYSPSELEEIREANFLLAGVLFMDTDSPFLVNSTPSYCTTLTQVYEACHAKQRNKNKSSSSSSSAEFDCLAPRQQAELRHAYRVNTDRIGMERHVLRMIRQGATERRKKILDLLGATTVQQKKNAKRTATTNKRGGGNGQTRLFAPRGERLRVRCESISRPARSFAALVATAQCS